MVDQVEAGVWKRQPLTHVVLQNARTRVHIEIDECGMTSFGATAEVQQRATIDAWSAARECHHS